MTHKTLSTFEIHKHTKHPWADVFHDTTFTRFAGRYEKEHPEWKTLEDADDWAWENARNEYYDFISAISDGEINPPPSYRLFWKGQKERRDRYYAQMRKKLLPQISGCLKFKKGDF